MSIKMEQLKLESLNTVLATDEELRSLAGVAKSVILKRLGVLTDDEQYGIGIVKYVHPETHPADMIVQDGRHQFVTSAEKEAWNNTYTKAEVNNLVSTIVLGLDWQARVEYYSQLATTYPNPEDGFTVQVFEKNSVFRYDAARGKWIDIYLSLVPTVTATVTGSMTPEMYKKLLNIEPNANYYVHPSTHSADMITSGNVNTVFTHEDKAKLLNLSDVGTYVHPDTHPASMIVTDAERRFVSDREKLEFRDKYTKSQIDGKLSLVVSGQNPKEAVATQEDLYSLPATKGDTRKIITTGETFYFDGTSWVRISTSDVPMADSKTNGLLAKEDFIKLATIKPGAEPHPVGDGNWHVPEIANTNFNKILAAGTLGNLEVVELKVVNNVSADGTIRLNYSFKAINDQYQNPEDPVVIEKFGTVQRIVKRTDDIESVTTGLLTEVRRDQAVMKYFDVVVKPTRSEDTNLLDTLVFTSKSKYPHKASFLIENVKSDVSSTLVINQQGLAPVNERFSITITSGSNVNGGVTLDLGNSDYIVNIHVFSNDTAAAIAKRLREAILRETPFNVDTINPTFPETIVVTAPYSGNINTATFTSDSVVKGEVFTQVQGEIGRSERVSLAFVTPSKVFGTLGVYFNDQSFEKTFAIRLDENLQPIAIATKVRNEMIANSYISANYSVTINPAKPNTLIIERKTLQDIELQVIVTDIFCGVGLVQDETKHTVGSIQIPTSWKEQLTINGKKFGNVTKTDVLVTLEKPDLIEKVNEVTNWKSIFDNYLNLGSREFVDKLNDLFDAYDSGTIAQSYNISSNFAGYTSYKEINHNFLKGHYTAIVTPTENPNGRLGEVFVEKLDHKVRVYNTGSFTGGFDIQIQSAKQTTAQ